MRLRCSTSLGMRPAGKLGLLWGASCAWPAAVRDCQQDLGHRGSGAKAVACVRVVA